MLRIPFNPATSADQTFDVLVPEKLVLNLRLVWSVRAKRWDVTVSTTNGEIGMFRLLPAYPLLREHKALSPIEGDIIALPLSGTAPSMEEYDALGKTWGLFWLSPEDVKAWEDANGLG